MEVLGTKKAGNAVEKKVVGRKYVMLVDGDFGQGTILELVKYNGTNYPPFEDVNTGKKAFVDMRKVALIDEESVTAKGGICTIELTDKEVSYIAGIMGITPTGDGFHYLYDQFLDLEKKGGK